LMSTDDSNLPNPIVDVNALELVQATLADTPSVLAILEDAVLWLRTKQLSTWEPNHLKIVMPVAIERGEVYLAKLKPTESDVPTDISIDISITVGTVSMQWSDVPFWGEEIGNDSKACYLHKLAVLRSYAGQHIGAAIVKLVEQRTSGAGRSYVRLDCVRDNPNINAFYQKLGYVWQGAASVGGFQANLYQKDLRTTS
jgi:GNAT superfamily N-acetyltransferase